MTPRLNAALAVLDAISGPPKAIQAFVAVIEAAIEAYEAAAEHAAEEHRAELQVYADALTEAFDEVDALRAQLAAADPFGLARLFTAQL